MHVNILERVRCLLKTGIGLEHHVILIELGEDGGDLALSKGVIERVVDGLGKDSEAPGCVAVDDKVNLQTIGQLVRGDVAKLRQSFQLVDKTRYPQVQVVSVGRLERVLKLCAADAVFDSEVLHGLHVERDSRNVCQLWLQAANNV